MSSPAAIPSTPSATPGLTSSQASGAPSRPCFGAALRVLSAERITPIGFTRATLRFTIDLLSDLVVETTRPTPAANVKTGMEEGARISYDRLEDLLRELQS